MITFLVRNPDAIFSGHHSPKIVPGAVTFQNLEAMSKVKYVKLHLLLFLKKKFRNLIE